ncbi:hypothetical protein F5Y04DRAFT_252333 [Hypomontagnella monticulosa]|nr:hypothetical protein F5Y04DRAFT_252333 [Hypomontagnella monticulosa]
MAEIPDSDSSDPLSSTPTEGTSTPIPPWSPSPSPSLSPSIASTIVSTISDLDSLDSLPSDHLQLPRHLFHNHHGHSSPSSNSASSDTPPSVSSMPSSNGTGAFLDLLDNLFPENLPGDENHEGEDTYDDLFDSEDSEESLFVNNRYDDNSSNLSDPDDVPTVPLLPAWQDFPQPNAFQDFDILNIRENRMDRFGDRDSQEANLGDELVEMEMAGPGNQRDQRRLRQPQPRAQPEVIDLTGDNDTPAQPPRNHSQNARRRQPQQRGSPPRLARSDASYVGRTVIDLISDSDEEPRPQYQPTPPPRFIDLDNAEPPVPAFGLAPNRRRGPEPVNRLNNDDAFRRRFRAVIDNIPVLRGMLNYQAMGDNHEADDLVMLGQRNVIADPLPPPPLDLPAINLNYGAHPFPNQPHAAGGLNQKPAHEPPKEARDGFTRNTGDDVVAICASCDEELAYDPDEDDGSRPPPAKKARTKKDNAEHHFWAVKACGHVYCRRCYENRKPVGKRAIPVGFRPMPNVKNKVLCAVEDCDTDVSTKNAWVGIFL